MTDQLQLVEKHIDLIQQETLDTLLKQDDANSISIFLPTHKRGAEIEQDPIRFKNLVSEVEEKLESRGLSPNQIESLLKPAYQLLSESERDFWQYQSDGLVIFIANDRAYTFRLPISFEPMNYIGDHFYVKPLLPLLETNGHYYILTLEQENVQLWQGTRFKLGQVVLNDVPTSLSEFTKYNEYQEGNQAHSGSSSGSDAVYHGDGNAADDANLKAMITDFFRQVENKVTALLSATNVPLIIVGNSQLQGIYREVDSYAHTLADGIQKHPDSLDENTLHSKAWDIVKHKFEKDEEAALGRYQSLDGNDDEQAANAIGQIVPAAYFQRIDTLFVERGKQIWGVFSADDNQVELHDKRQNDSVDLMDYAVIHTLRNGGTVYTLDELPNGAHSVAILRY